MDCTCGASGKERNFQIDKPEGKENERTPCPENPKVKLKLMGMKTFGGKTMSKDERIASLKKRSKDHHKREIEEVKRAKIKRFDETGYN
jgi:hypothetical protein